MPVARPPSFRLRMPAGRPTLRKTWRLLSPYTSLKPWNSRFETGHADIDQECREFFRQRTALNAPPTPGRVAIG